MKALGAILLALQAAAAGGAERVSVTVLATTDMHGYVYPYDYFTRQPAARGLAAAATLIAGVRRETKNVLLVDCGDTIQGSPLAGVYQSERRAGRTRAPEPMMLAMSRVGYDAMVVGNHEFNFGPDSFEAARSAAGFPWLSANAPSDGSRIRPLAPFVVKTVAGVKVAVVGITTPAVPQWEKPENIRGVRFTGAVEAVEAALTALQTERPDVTIVALHSGLGRPPEREAGARPYDLPGENAAGDVAERFQDLAAVVYGHSHRREAGLRVGKVLLVQPKNWATDVARIDLTLERAPGADRFALVDVASRLLPVTPETPPDQGVLELARPYHEAAERELDRPVTESRTALSGARGRFEDSALVDAIHEVQLHYSGAQVSLASLFQTRVEFPRGPVTRRELAALYLYDNELYAVDGTGGMLRAALENATRYFRTCPDPACEAGPLVDRGVPGYNYDMAQGVAYEVDLRQPAGSRIRNLSYRGAPLRDEQPLRIALNNYRAAGSGGYTMFRDAKIVYRSGREIRELLGEYFGAGRRLPEKPDGNWRLLPDRALLTLVREQAEP